MKKPLNTLIIEDHPLIVDVYTRALENVSTNSNMIFNIKVAKTCDEANKKRKKNPEKQILIRKRSIRPRKERMLSPEAVVGMMDLREYLQDDLKHTQHESVNKDEDNSCILSEEAKDEDESNEEINAPRNTVSDNKVSTKADTIFTSNSGQVSISYFNFIGLRAQSRTKQYRKV